MWDCEKNWPDESAWWLRLVISIAPKKKKKKILRRNPLSFQVTLPETTSKSPENGWLEDDPFLLGLPIFRGYVSFREYIYHLFSWKVHHQPTFQTRQTQQPLRSTNSSSGRSKTSNFTGGSTQDLALLGHLSQEKNNSYFLWNPGWLIGIIPI